MSNNLEQRITDYLECRDELANLQSAKPADHIRDATEMVPAGEGVGLPVVAWQYKDTASFIRDEHIEECRRNGESWKPLTDHATATAEIAKRDARIESLQRELNNTKHNLEVNERLLGDHYHVEQELRAKLAGVDGLVEAMKEVLRISDKKHDAWDKAKELIATYEAAQGEK